VPTSIPGDDGGEESIRNSAISGAKWTVLDKWGNRLASFATFAVLAYLLGPEAFGIVAAAQVAVALLQTVSEQGVGAALIVRDREDRFTTSTSFWIASAAGLVGALLLILMAPTVADLMNADELAQVLPALSLFLLLRGFAIVPEALLQRRLQFKQLAIRTILASVFSAIAAISMAVLGFGVWALVAQILIQGAVSLMAVLAYARIRLTLVVSISSAKEILAFGWRVFLVDLATVGVAQGDKLVVGALLGPVALGYYTIAYRALNVFVDAFTGVMSVMATPVFARLRSNVEYSAIVHERVTSISLLITIPAFGALALFAPLVVPTVFGPGWNESVALLQIIAVGGALSSVTYFDRGVLYASNRAGLELIIVTVMAAGTVTAALAGAQYGLTAVAVAVTARVLLTVPLRVGVVSSVLRVPWFSYVRSWAAPLVCGGVVALSVLLLRANGVVGGGWLATVGIGAGGVTAYLIGIFLTDRNLLFRTVRVLRSRRM